MTSLQFFVFTALPVTGMCYAVLGALKLPLVERLGIDEAKVGGLLSAFGIMVGPIILAAGFLADSLGRQGVWIGGSALVTIALLLLSRARGYGAAVAAVSLLSVGWAAMVNVVNPVMVMAFKNPVTATNTGDFFFGLGAFCTPAIVAFLLRRCGYSRAVALLAAAAAFAFVLGFFIDLDPQIAHAATDTPVPASENGFGTLMRDPVVWFCTLTLMLWAPLESSTAAWTTSFVTDQAPEGEDEPRTQRIAALTLSGFWMCFMGARLLMAVYHQFVSDSDDPIGGTRELHVVLAVLAIVALIGLVRSRKRRVTIGIILAMGLISGPYVPGVLAILLSHVPGEVAGRAVGVAFAGASIGWTLVPLLIGRRATTSKSLHRGFHVAVATAAVLLVLVIAHLCYA